MKRTGGVRTIINICAAVNEKSEPSDKVTKSSAPERQGIVVHSCSHVPEGARYGWAWEKLWTEIAGLARVPANGTAFWGAVFWASRERD